MALHQLSTVLHRFIQTTPPSSLFLSPPPSFAHNILLEARFHPHTYTTTIGFCFNFTLERCFWIKTRTRQAGVSTSHHISCRSIAQVELQLLEKVCMASITTVGIASAHCDRPSYTLNDSRQRHRHLHSPDIESLWCSHSRSRV